MAYILLILWLKLIENTSKNFEIWYDEHVSEIKCKQAFSKSDFSYHVLGNTNAMFISVQKRFYYYK